MIILTLDPPGFLLSLFGIGYYQKINKIICFIHSTVQLPCLIYVHSGKTPWLICVKEILSGKCVIDFNGMLWFLWKLSHTENSMSC